ncbi:hypothetical protein Ae717Ps2_7268 [Pseudonocardia sp. Ae717_Ps2]|uniref:hypothetical protein n=1 Tax=Pseudonocardia sp. Ae717_Ps2 TaxID=1885573 RepID=UPI00094B48F4|nr:hypothetical protein [Pseudonocardia sp. Ae717_Ps2]OLM27657.1 hypothetical protein Ae717Ps2_7268 [Pseudonocardia sp. Ae717_Ps2]
MWSRQRAEDRAAREFVDRLVNPWRRVCERVPGLSHTVQVASGTTIVIPTLARADLSGPDPVLVVRKIHGQLIEDFRADEASRRIAAALGYDRIRVYPRGSEWVRIELLIGDPLDGEVPAPLAGRGLSVSDVEITIARDELGNPLRQSWVEGPHVCIQGATRSGKSVWCYSALAQLARLDDVLIAGSDLSGLLLGRPYVGTRHHEWQATGSADVEAHRDLLVRLVAEMDTRIRNLPPRRDKFTRFHAGFPLIVVVLEEFAGLLRLASTAPVEKGQPKMREQLLALYGRLVSEGHKAGLRLMVVTQRADATVVGGFERGQLGLRISFRLDDPEALVMLHGQSARDHLEGTSSPRPGSRWSSTRPAVGPGPRTAADGPLGGRRLRPLLGRDRGRRGALHEVAA